ncbi:MAG TPA: YqhA family protein [Rectinemataceae bacterium]|nr:YqhA family protein [Rectinemataceae bacterium]
MVLVTVVASLVLAAAAILWGAYRCAVVLAGIVTDPHQASSVAFLKLMDIFLIGVALLVFSVGLYRLFIGELSLPEGLLADSLHELESKLGSLVILVMAIHLLEQFIEWGEPRSIVSMALVFVLASAAIIANNVLVNRGKDQPRDPGREARG